MDKKVAIIGCGAIGSEIAVNIDARNIPNCTLSILFDTDSQKLNLLNDKLINKPLATFNNFTSFITSTIFKSVNLVIEAASVKAAQSYMINILEHKKDIMIMSIGAFSESTFYEKVIQILNNSDRNIYLPSGAIGGVDIIKSVKGYIEEVTLVTTKNNVSFKDAPFIQNNAIIIENILEKKVLFDGNASDAIKGFPSNVNVSALISLAGIGFNKTRVKIVVDPKIVDNQHEIQVKWKYGDFHIKVINKPSPNNPKTSYLAILSALECLKSICSKDLKIGS